jgi:hypothetical protein
MEQAFGLHETQAPFGLYDARLGRRRSFPQR